VIQEMNKKGKQLGKWSLKIVAHCVPSAICEKREDKDIMQVSSTFFFEEVPLVRI